MLTRPAEISFVVPCFLSEKGYLHVLNTFEVILAEFENAPQNIRCTPISTTSATISFQLGSAIVRGKMERSLKHQEVRISLIVPMDYAVMHFNGGIPQECMRLWFIQAYAPQGVEGEPALA